MSERGTTKGKPQETGGGNPSLLGHPLIKIIVPAFMAGTAVIIFLFANFVTQREETQFKENVEATIQELSDELRILRGDVGDLASATPHAAARVGVGEAQSSTGPGTQPPAGDLFSVGRHYTPSGYMGDIGDVSVAAEEGGVVRFTYVTNGRGPHEWYWKYIGGELNPNLSQFAGVMWLNPPNAFGTAPDCGYDLRLFRRKVSWEARSVGEPVNVEFFLGGVTWIWEQEPGGVWVRSPAPYADSMPRLTLGIHKLHREWRSLDMPVDRLPEDQFRRVVGGFGWTANWANNQVELNAEGTGPRAAREFDFEIRNIRYE